jgi:hypothetical protein
MDEAFAEICRRTSIKEYLEAKGVALQKSGKHMKCKCPLPGHEDDHDPSFYITTKADGVELFKCFGCGNGGSIITLIHLMENMKKGDVVDRLAAKAGVSLKGLIGAKIEPLQDEIMEVFCEEDGASEAASNFVVRMMERKVTPDAVSRIAKLYMKMDEACDLGEKNSMIEIKNSIAAVVAAYNEGGRKDEKEAKGR